MSTENLSTDTEFEADMAYLRGLSDFMFETLGQHLSWPHDTIYDQLIADMSPAARRAVA